jgi:hypothetical protein
MNSLVLSGLILSSVPLSAEEPVPPFVAEGTISTSNRFSNTEARFSFFHSNDWWQVDLKNFTMPPNYVSQNCMSIPGGVRHYTVLRSITNSLFANACPIEFPPPGIAGGMFETWLGLCPNPKLPLIDARHIHRFLAVPSAPFGLFTDPANHGEHNLKFLEPAQAFLSELTIRNDGICIAWQPGGSEMRRSSAPFENGFTELEYRVLEVTNVNGFAFPKRSVLKHFGPDPETGRELTVTLECELWVSRISFASADLSTQVHPLHLGAFDYRPRHLPRSESWATIITNDQWLAVPARERYPADN